ncbi:two-component system response regulator YesN [Anaerobacterium chartisolvens]|uniref:Stage 0 sporulation protein A homolog n=1 Tax=Anaerobacterium chartisolvens TaxID=1297424 RepID=A0A369B8I4_9FIRM|nr:response regulator transcription factor [Anaerobacterium chartisolvens]RCX17840.1 two-component system response regulator YesN [Anaerobacterium chartisolvens]
MTMRKVLLVDDEPFILDGLKNIIDWKAYGFEISGQALNGEEAYAIFLKEPCDVLITDITMPKMDGLKLISKVKRLNPDTKFIVLSGYNEFDFVKQGIVLGIENYLLKPVNIEELVSTLTNTLKKLESSVYSDIYSNENFNILRDNILYRWATDRIDYSELKERSEVLQINISHSYYWACILKVSFRRSSKSSAAYAKLPPFSTVYSSIYTVIGQNSSCLCFNNFDGEFILIFGSESEATGEAFIRQKLDVLRPEVERLPNMGVFITVGDCQPGCTNLCKSYSHAKQMQEYSLINPHEKILFYQASNDEPQSDSTQFKIDYQCLSKLLLSKNKEEASEFIDSVFEAMQSSPNITPSYIHNCCIEMLLHINKTVHNFDYSSSFAENDYKELFLSVIKLHSLEHLKDYIKSIAENAINCLIADDNRVSPIIRQVLNHINKHYTEELSLKTLGHRLNVSPVYLGQLFQKEVGQLFNEYVNVFKMEKAKQMLLNTNLTATEISKKIGFPDSNYFFRLFKKYVGVSPSELRLHKQY